MFSKQQKEYLIQKIKESNKLLFQELTKVQRPEKFIEEKSEIKFSEKSNKRFCLKIF